MFVKKQTSGKLKRFRIKLVGGNIEDGPKKSDNDIDCNAAPYFLPAHISSCKYLSDQQVQREDHERGKETTINKKDCFRIRPK